MHSRLFLVIFTALLAQPCVAWAQTYKKPLKDAARALDDAETKVDRAGGRCRAALSDLLEATAEKVRTLRKGDGPRLRELSQLRAEVAGYASSASFSGCPYSVLEDLQRALEHLEDARLALWRERQGRGRRWDDDGSPPGPSGYAYAQLQALKVQTDATYEGERAVKLSVPELRLSGMQGATFYLGTRYRSYEGQWSEWVTTSAWTVPSDPFVWKNAFHHFLRYSTLAEDDFSQGRFVARVSVFDGYGRELAFREVTFRVTLPQLPSAPPLMQPPPVARRDCGSGAGADIGCEMQRDGQFPMDATTFNGFLAALRSNASEAQRQRICEATFQRSYVTAFQLGMVLDLFASDAARLVVARFAAPRVVNPQHALGFASKWSSSAQGAQYTQVMTAQIPGHPAQQPLPVQPPGAYRDCGTGNDPGCGMARNGQYPMDAPTFLGFLTSLRSNGNELVRADIAENVLRTGYLTALQLSQVLDQFSNELTRLDVAKTAAPKVVNPQHALGLSAKFSNTFNAEEYVEVMTAQMGR
jgi:hypothetical protein